MNKFLAAFFLSVALVLSTGVWSPLHAQDPTDGSDGTGEVGDAGDSGDGGDSGDVSDPGDPGNVGDLTDPSVIFETLVTPVGGGVVHVSFFLNYSGTVTQTTAAGVTTTGTLHLNVENRGKIYGTLTINGTETHYVGFIRRKASRGRNGTGSGYLIPADDSKTRRLPGAAKIPLVVEKGVFQGGTMDEAGTMLVFRGTLDMIQPASATATGRWTGH